MRKAISIVVSLAVLIGAIYLISNSVNNLAQTDTKVAALKAEKDRLGMEMLSECVATPPTDIESQQACDDVLTQVKNDCDTFKQTCADYRLNQYFDIRTEAASANTPVSEDKPEAVDIKAVTFHKEFDVQDGVTIYFMNELCDVAKYDKYKTSLKNGEAYSNTKYPPFYFGCVLDVIDFTDLHENKIVELRQNNENETFLFVYPPAWQESFWSRYNPLGGYDAYGGPYGTESYIQMQGDGVGFARDSIASITFVLCETHQVCIFADEDGSVAYVGRM